MPNPARTTYQKARATAGADEPRGPVLLGCRRCVEGRLGAAQAGVLKDFPQFSPLRPSSQIAQGGARVGHAGGTGASVDRRHYLSAS